VTSTIAIHPEPAISHPPTALWRLAIAVPDHRDRPAHDSSPAHATAAAEAPTEMSDGWIAQVCPDLRRSAWSMTGDHAAADDLAQETLIACRSTSTHSAKTKSSPSVRFWSNRLPKSFC